MGVGFETFMNNPYWRDIYENAPSDNLKEHYRLMFDHNSFVSEGEMSEGIKEALRNLSLSLEDIVYLLEHAGVNVAKVYYSNIIKRLEQEPEGTCVAAITCCGEIRNPWYMPHEETMTKDNNNESVDPA